MLNTMPQYSHITEEEYYALEERAEIRHEYFNGEIFDLPGNSPEHAILSANAIAALGTRLRGHPCYVTGSDLRIKVEQTGLITYPDLEIVCPPARYDPANKDTLLNPRVVLEVLSRTTEQYDKTVKFDNYSSIESLTDYILVRQDRVEVTHYHREMGGDWESALLVTRDSSLKLGELGLDVPLAEIYDRLDLPEGEG